MIDRDHNTAGSRAMPTAHFRTSGKYYSAHFKAASPEAKDRRRLRCALRLCEADLEEALDFYGLMGRSLREQFPAASKDNESPMFYLLTQLKERTAEVRGSLAKVRAALGEEQESEAA